MIHLKTLNNVFEYLKNINILKKIFKKDYDNLVYIIYEFGQNLLTKTSPKLKISTNFS